MSDDELRVLPNGFAPRTDEHGRARLPTPYAPMIDPCRVCPARCCHQQVLVPIPEAVAIAAALAIPFLDVVSLTPTTGARAFPIDDDPRIHVRMTPFAGKVELTLRRTEIGRCAFLADHSGFLRCSIYGLRPGGCRTYPVSWTMGGVRGSPAQVLCPLPFAVTPQVEAALADDVRALLDAWAIHDAISARWTAQEDGDRSVDRFVAFALRETQAATGVDASRIPESREAVEALVRERLGRG